MEDELGRSADRGRQVDLDAAAAEIELRRGPWTAAGFEVGELTWRDLAAGWPYPLVGRSEAVAPDSVGVQASRAPVKFRIVLFARHWQDRPGGFADVEGVNLQTGVYEITAPDVPTIKSFGELLDATFDRWSGE